ncbi:MAG TPA: alpha-amylase family glycosyl hydrolase, partial [Candidatus Limnocylindria bacterium]|nr:alpha-amylase family glycosyl hydrolase [Candidatus Limnocylindria bacterium]
LSPIFPSPMADFGYDVADYTGVDPIFGSLAELDGLIEDLHRRDMRLLLDFVPNHTSDRHPWFADSRSARTAARRDWYIWRDPAWDGGAPNDWQSMFGGSAWELDQRTGQYYFHAFLREQPDLDWTNPRVRAEMHDVMRFWLRRGIDGFRIDVLWMLAKRPELEQLPVGERMGPPGPTNYWRDEPEIHDIVAELRAVADEFDDRLLVGELYQDVERLVTYYGEDGRGIHLPFNFQLLLLPWRAPCIRPVVRRYESLLPEGAWPNWVLGNHDNSRIASRAGAAQARVAAMLLLTLRGTPTLYYGDELGMADVDIPPDAMRDPQGLRGGFNRDVARTPMRWAGGPQAGFSDGRPWLPIGPGVGQINVAAQFDDQASMLSYYRRLLELRRREPALHAGEWHDLGGRGSVLAYLRSDSGKRFLVALNLAGRRAALPPAARGLRGRIALSTDPADDGRSWLAEGTLAANRGVVVELD